MRKIAIALLMTVAPAAAIAAGGANVHLDKANNDISNQDSLRNGASVFMSYCSGCHSAKFVRYNRIAQDLGIPEDLLKANLMPNKSAKVGDQITIAMQAGDAEGWFGTLPPDLSLVARTRGNDWLYTYMRSFYLDPKKPSGVNNVVFKDVGMPHVTGRLQGWQEAVFKKECKEEEIEDKDGNKSTTKVCKDVFQHFNKVTEGTMSTEEYDDTVRDLVNFLDYMGEPIKLTRQRLGVKVMIFMLLLTGLAFLLKREYWKDVH